MYGTFKDFHSMRFSKVFLFFCFSLAYRSLWYSQNKGVDNISIGEFFECNF